MTRTMCHVAFTILLSGLLSGCRDVADRQASDQQAYDALLITGGTLIDGTGSAPQPNAAVLITGDKITAVGRAGELTAPAGARTIRADGKFIMPGFWDSHIHYRWWHGELMLHYGVTTAVDMGNRTYWILAIRDGVAKGKVRAPRIYSLGWLLNGSLPRRQREEPRVRITRTQAHNRYSLMENFPNGITILGGPEAMRAFVLSEIEAGVDGFKAFPNMTREELRVITSEAHKRGLPVIGHADHAYDQFEDGFDGVTHLHGLARTLLSEQDEADLREGRAHTPYIAFRKENSAKIDELIALMVKHNVFLGPGLIHDHAPVIGAVEEFEKEDEQIFANPNLAYIAEDTRLATRDYLHFFRSDSTRYGPWAVKEMLPPEVVQQFRDGYENSKDVVRRFVKAGGKLFIGTDLGGTAFVPGLSVHRDMRVLVEEVGLTPMQAILSATRDSAAMMKKDAIIGTVEVGKLADLLIVTADPLADIKNTQKVDTVIKDGKVVDRTLHPDYSVPFREEGHLGAHNLSFAVPGIITLSPPAVVEGAPDTRVQLEGSGLRMESKVFVDGTPVPTELTHEEQLTFTIPANLLTTGGTKAVTVVNRRPGGGTSKAYPFVVRFR